jgi:hypothetical protein
MNADPNTDSRLRNIENFDTTVAQAVNALRAAVAQIQSQMATVRQAPVAGSPAAGGQTLLAFVPSGSTWAAATGTVPAITPNTTSWEIYSSQGGTVATDTGSTHACYNWAGAIVGPTMVLLDANYNAVVVPC